MIGNLNDELERMWKKPVVALLKVLFQYLPGGTEGNHEKPQSELQVSSRDLNPGPSQY
jgi:hypothetical protein